MTCACSRREFLGQPGPTTAALRCTILRDTSGSKMYPTYSLYLDDPAELMMAACKRRKSKTSNYVLSIDDKVWGPALVQLMHAGIVACWLHLNCFVVYSCICGSGFAWRPRYKGCTPVLGHCGAFAGALKRVACVAQDLKRGAFGYCGKVRSNFVGTQFLLFDGGAKPKAQSRGAPQ